jgi:general secretion pathway protein G
MKRFLPFLIAFLGIPIALIISFVLYPNIFEGRFRSIPEDYVTLVIPPLLEAYKADTGSYPTTAQGLIALRKLPAGLKNWKDWKGPYVDPLKVKDVPLDPWGHPYHYRSPGLHNPATYDVWSVGPDSADGTADDIGNW